MIATLRANPLPASPELPAARAVLGGKPVHILDVQAETGVHLNLVRQMGTRTLLVVPLLREGANIGSLTIWRDFVEPFTERQIELVKTFADQAVIAIENVRLFKELGDRNAELREALEHQTATAEVLGIISRSPTDVQPVLEAIVASAARVCGVDDMTLRLREGSSMVSRAHFGPVPTPASRVEISIDAPEFRWIRERGALHVPDARAQNEFPMLGSAGTARTFLTVPLRQQGEFIGSLTARRTEARPFTPAQIKLLGTFADQAVIAIENVRLFQELKDLLEQQTATSEILGVIASSPTDIQPVLDTVAANAARLCEATDAQIRLVDGDGTRLAASFGTLPAPQFRSMTLGSVSARAILNRETVHIQDLQEERKHGLSDSTSSETRTFLSTPMLREGTPIGAINIRRTEVRPFSEKQIKLLETFASQAVIAIENVRLFQELKEALEQQTATSEILGVIASSPTDIQPVLNTVAANAARLCEATDAQIRLVEGDQSRLVASFGNVPAPELRPTISGTVSGRAIFNRQTIHVHDLQEATKSEFPESVGASFGVRTMLCTPMLRERTPIGVITVRRTEVRPFSDKQIKLLETFASQAVIAIENVRLFQELKESLEQQTATSEILGVIASSPTDLQPVFQAIVGSAARLCEATFAALHRFDGQVITFDAHHGMTEPEVQEARSRFPRLPDRDIAVGRAILDRNIAHIHDIRRDPEYNLTAGQMTFRTVLAVPLLRESTPVGVIGLWRREVQPFTDKQIALVNMFANQAVIAIENVRLFKELDERNSELREALEHQTATAEVLSIISRSPTDVQPVLDAIVESAARVCGIDDVHLRLQAGNMMVSRAHFGPVPVGTVAAQY